ncbi:MAG: hypothetical protein KBD15_00720 [Candidatus Magasanikbacteria bacterium]|jgi:hypothetical protein|nr:hypothetical protein [Candidatus Magasanikbacteria bacterium]
MEILWVSKSHEPPLPIQIQALTTLKGQRRVQIDHRHIENAQVLAREFRQGGYGDLVCIAPQSVMARITQEGVHPLRPCMTYTAPTIGGRRAPDLRLPNGNFWFSHFERVEKVALNLVAVHPATDVRRVLRITRHLLQRPEEAALKHVFGPRVVIETLQPTESSMSAEWVIQQANQYRATEVVLVAPWAVYKFLAERGCFALYSQFDPANRFVALWRCLGVEERVTRV